MGPLGIARQPWYRALVHWMIAAILLPFFVAVFPAVPLSADAALARELAQSICEQKTPSDQSDGDYGFSHNGHHCILCRVTCTDLTPVVIGAAVDIAVMRPANGPERHFAVNRAVPTKLLRLYGSPPTGPPSHLPI